MPSHAAASRIRYLGALARFGVGLDHLEQFSVHHYSAIPTIGTLFAVNFASAAALASGLAAPAQRLPGRAGRAAVPLLSVSGIGVAAGSLAGLLISENAGLFGFMETGYRSSILLSIALEVTAIGLLSLHLAVTRRTRPRRAGRNGPASDITVSLPIGGGPRSFVTDRVCEGLSDVDCLLSVPMTPTPLGGAPDHAEEPRSCLPPRSEEDT